MKKIILITVSFVFITIGCKTSTVNTPSNGLNVTFEPKSESKVSGEGTNSALAIGCNDTSPFCGGKVKASCLGRRIRSFIVLQIQE